MAKILVVDDDKTILAVLGKILTGAGFYVETAADGSMALERLAQVKFDLIVTDANMPGISGFNLIQLVRSTSKYGLPRSLMLTGRRTKADVQRAYNTGIDDYMVKPVVPRVFLAKVKTLLDIEADGSEPKASYGGSLTAALEITEVNEFGLRIETLIPLEKGLSITVESDVFEAIGIRAPRLLIEGSEKRSGGYSAWARFSSLTEAEQGKIKEWLEGIDRKSSRKPA